jgi:hypothetical protein
MNHPHVTEIRNPFIGIESKTATVKKTHPMAAGIINSLFYQEPTL